MNKSMKMWMLAAILVFCGTNMTNCGNKTAKQTENQVQTETPTQPEAEVVEEPTCITAIDKYLVNEIGKNYSQGDLCIPYVYVVSIDESNPDDILVWGDFWVFNYELSGDTLKTVSGGSHPGLIHVKKTENGFEVTNLDAVADGADNLPTAKRIFSEKFDAFQEINSNQEKREDMRLRFTADYVKKHNLSAKLLQDFGWPAVELPQ
jgi:hypothetical protein